MTLSNTLRESFVAYSTATGKDLTGPIRELVEAVEQADLALALLALNKLKEAVE